MCVARPVVCFRYRDTGRINDRWHRRHDFIGNVVDRWRLRRDCIGHVIDQWRLRRDCIRHFIDRWHFRRDYIGHLFGAWRLRHHFIGHLVHQWRLWGGFIGTVFGRRRHWRTVVGVVIDRHWRRDRGLFRERDFQSQHGERCGVLLFDKDRLGQRHACQGGADGGLQLTPLLCRCACLIDGERRSMLAPIGESAQLVGMLGRCVRRVPTGQRRCLERGGLRLRIRDGGLGLCHSGGGIIGDAPRFCHFLLLAHDQAFGFTSGSLGHFQAALLHKLGGRGVGGHGLGEAGLGLQAGGLAASGVGVSAALCNHCLRVCDFAGGFAQGRLRIYPAGRHQLCLGIRKLDPRLCRHYVRFGSDDLLLCCRGEFDGARGQGLVIACFGIGVVGIADGGRHRSVAVLPVSFRLHEYLRGRDLLLHRQSQCRLGLLGDQGGVSELLVQRGLRCFPCGQLGGGRRLERREQARCGRCWHGHGRLLRCQSEVLGLRYLPLRFRDPRVRRFEIHLGRRQSEFRATQCIFAGRGGDAGGFGAAGGFRREPAGVAGFLHSGIGEVIGRGEQTRLTVDVCQSLPGQLRRLIPGHVRRHSGAVGLPLLNLGVGEYAILQAEPGEYLFDVLLGAVGSVPAHGGTISGAGGGAIGGGRGCHRRADGAGCCVKGGPRLAQSGIGFAGIGIGAFSGGTPPHEFTLPSQSQG